MLFRSDQVKKISKNSFNWNEEKTDEARRFLSELKRIWTEFNNGPFEYMSNKISKHYNSLINIDQDNVVYFIHCREPKEIQKFLDKYGDNCVTLLVRRNNVNVPNNESDKNVENFDYDYYIDNDGDKEDLKQKAKEFIKILWTN